MNERKLLPDLQEAIRELRELERRLFSQRGRFWAHKYLEEVYRISQSLSDEEVEELCGDDDAGESDVLRSLLAQTTKADAKTRSRWLQALAHVHDMLEDEGGSVQKLLSQLGGISGCARAEAMPRRKRGEKFRDWN